MTTWYKNLERVKGSKTLALKEVVDQTYLIIARDSEEGKEYAYFKDEKEFFKYYYDQPNKNYYEVISGNQKPHLDIVAPIDQIKHTSNLTYFGRDIVKIFIDSCCYFIPDLLQEHIIVLNSHTDTHLCFHIILHNFYHVDSINAREFYKKIKGYVKPEYEPYLQFTYDENQCYPLYLSNINGVDKNCKVPYDDEQILNYSLITNIDYCIELPPFKPSLLTKVSESGKEQVIIDEKNSLSVKEIAKYYKQSDKGLVDLYYYYFRDFLYCVSQSAGEFYLYNKHTLLWESKTNYDILAHFMEEMRIIIKPLYEYFKEEKELKIANYAYKDKRCYCVAKANPLVKLIISKFYNKCFLSLLNSKKDLIPVKNGIINLRTGQLRPRTYEDYFTFELDVKWKGLNYNTKDIDQFFKDIMLDDMDLVKYLQWLLGYSITGYVTEQLFVIFYGTGSNGKGVLQNLLEKLLGDYYRSLTKDVIIKCGDSNPGAPSPHVMQLHGARIAIFEESERGDKLNEGVIKKITGAGAISGRYVYGKEIITFEPTHQLILMSNFKPNFDGLDPAIIRRLKLIPFDASFKDQKDFDITNPTHRRRDKDLEAKLEKKLDQLLVWIVRGSLEYFRQKETQKNARVEAATAQYIKDNDPMGLFIEEYCEVEKDAFVSSSELLFLYLGEHKHTTSKDLKALMEAKGFVYGRHKNIHGYKGLRLKVEGGNKEMPAK